MLKKAHSKADPQRVLKEARELVHNSRGGKEAKKLFNAGKIHHAGAELYMQQGMNAYAQTAADIVVYVNISTLPCILFAWTSVWSADIPVRVYIFADKNVRTPLFTPCRGYKQKDIAVHFTVCGSAENVQ